MKSENTVWHAQSVSREMREQCVPRSLHKTAEQSIALSAQEIINALSK